MPTQRPTDTDAPTEPEVPDQPTDVAAYAVDLDEQRILFGIDQADVPTYLADEEWTVLLTPDYEAAKGDDPIEVVPDDAITVAPDAPPAGDASVRD